MAITIKHKNGKPDETVTPSGAVTDTMYGPPPSGAPNYRGVYVVQVAGASGTFRCVEEHYTPGVASPTSYSYAVK